MKKAAIIIFSVTILCVGYWLFFTAHFGHASRPMKTLVVLFVRREIPLRIERFYKDVGRYPTTEEGLDVLIHAPRVDSERWKGPYFDGTEIQKDPWMHDYVYRAPATKKGIAYEVISLGPDGKISGDDVSSITK